MLETDEGLNAISHVNHLLLKNSYASSPSYYVEFVKTPVLSTYHVTTYSLHVIRSEPARSVRIPYKQEPGKLMAMEVSKLVICEYNIEVEDSVVSSKINTLLAQRYMQDDLHYQQKGFATLLIHLLVHICACARLRQEVFCAHAASDKVYSVYTKKHLNDEKKPLATREYKWGANEYVIDSRLMDNDQVIKLKKVSMDGVEDVVTNMTNHREITLDANKYMVTIPL